MHGLYLLWWVQEKHVPAPIVATILAAGELAITVLEIPTGWLADRTGHRTSLILGSIAQIAGTVAAWLGAGAAGVIASCLLIALGDAFRSGADKALLYRSCAALGRDPEFQRLEARAQSLQTIALVALTLLGGAIVSRYGYAAGWIAEALSACAGLVVASAMLEPPPELLSTPADDEPLDEGPRLRVREWLPLLVTILPVSLLEAVTTAAQFLFLTAAGTDPEAMTLTVALLTLAEAAGSAAAAYLPTSRRLAIGLSAAGGLSAMAVAAFPSALPIVVVMLFAVTGTAVPVRTAALQRIAADAARARTASFASAVDKAFTSIGMLVAGFIR